MANIGLQINVLKIQQARCLHYLHFSAKHYLNLYRTFGLGKIQQLAIGVNDLEKATAFYRDPEDNILALASEVTKQ